MSGYYAVHIAEFNENGYGWYTDIIATGIGRYRTPEEAVDEGREWAKSELMPFEQ